jgi:hypothetical protein
MNQYRFAEFVGEKRDTINNIECKKVKLPPALMERIRRLTSAIWDGEEWLVDPALGWTLPFEAVSYRFSREAYDDILELKECPAPDSIRIKALERMAQALIKLGKAVPSSLWFVLLQEFEIFTQRVFDAWKQLEEQEEDDRREAAAEAELMKSKLKNPPSPSEKKIGFLGSIRAMRPNGTAPATSGRR